MADQAEWTDWRTFVVERRAQESGTITSFHLVPRDGAALEPHEPGQRLTLRMPGAGTGGVTRNYTLSAPANGRSLRISVKREAQGTVSRWLHDVVKVGDEIEALPPSGTFSLPPDEGRALVLVSAGVGITPMIAMLEAAAPAGRSVIFLHGARDGGAHAFNAHVRAIAACNSNFAVTCFYTSPGPQDVLGRDYDGIGRMTAQEVVSRLPDRDCDVFLCGPVSFMDGLKAGLARAGVPTHRIRTETFDAKTAPLTPVGATHAMVLDTSPLDQSSIGAALLNSASDAVVASDRAGTIVFWNPGAERIFGFAAEDALGQSLDIIIPEPLRARHWDGYHHTVATGVSRYGAGDMLSVPGLHREGHRLSLEFTIVLIKDACGVVTGMVSTIRDATRRFEETRALKKRVAELEALRGR